MRIGILGSKDENENNFLLMQDAVKNARFQVTEIVTRGEKGADRLAKQWAKQNGIELVEFKADWKDLDAPGAVIKTNSYGQYNANAGKYRDAQFIEYCDKAIWLCYNGDDSNSEFTAASFKKAGKDVFQWPEHDSEASYWYDF